MYLNKEKLTEEQSPGFQLVNCQHQQEQQDSVTDSFPALEELNLHMGKLPRPSTTTVYVFKMCPNVKKLGWTVPVLGVGKTRMSRNPEQLRHLR